MKEKDERAIEKCTFEQLLVMDDLLYLEEARGVDVTAVRKKVWEVINDKKDPYPNATREELINLEQRMRRLNHTDDIDMSPQIEGVKKAIEEKSNSGIIFQADNS